MASGLLGASSITTGGSCCRSKQSTKNYYARGIRFSACTPQLLHLPDPIKGSDVATLWNKTGKTQREYTVMRPSQRNLKYHCKCIGEGSTCQESERKYVVNATSEQLSEYEPKAQHPKSILDSAKRAWDIFFRFIRPFATISMAVGTTSKSLLAVEKLSDLSPIFFIGWLLALAHSLCVIAFNCGFNGLCDVEIDKINKPYLPLASGEMSFGTGVAIVASLFILGCWLALTAHSWPLFWISVAGAVHAVVYNVNLPLLRWKKSTVLAATILSLDAGAATTLGYFFHMQTVVFKRPATFPRQLIFSTAMLTLFFVVMAIFKDIPDIEGDQKFGIQSLAARLGGEQVFRICISLLEMAYGAAILVGATSPLLWSRVVTVVGHAILASILWYHAKSVDLKNTAAAQSFYLFIWKLLNAEYFLIPFFR